jgi:hypothetical protein
MTLTGATERQIQGMTALARSGARQEFVSRRCCLSLVRRFLYVYDFGGYWQHDVRLEAAFPSESGVKYPRVLDGARSCPPEDCGGAGGYADLLEILLDPTHEEFDHMREWAGPRFNAEVLSVDASNERLQKNQSLAVK